MKVLLIIYAIIFIITKIWANYIKNDLRANVKYQFNGSLGLSLLTLSKYVLGSIIVIKIILKLLGE